MNEMQLSAEQMTAVREAALILAAVVGMWVASDARSRGKTAISSIMWGMGSMMAMMFVLPLWFFLRPKTTSSTRSATPASQSPFSSPSTVGTSVPESGDKGRSKICDSCGKFYLGEFEKCPHCNAAIEKGKS